MDSAFKVEACPIIGKYNRQRFRQWSPEDAVNWYLVPGNDTKRPYAMYPSMGRAHINYLGVNQLIFGSEPRGEFKSIQYAYVVEGDTIYRIDSQYNQLAISNIVNTGGEGILTSSGPIYFKFLVINTIVFACFVDSQAMYVYQENTGLFYQVTDPLAPGGSGTIGKPGYIEAFGNRIVLSVANSSQFFLSVVNLLDPTTGMFNPATCFTNTGNSSGPSVFAQEDGLIRQMGVLNNTLYIFTDYITGVWSNTPAVFSGTNAYFPFKKNSTYNWNFGIANPSSLDIDFGIMVFLARNSDGLLEFRVSDGGQPEKISDKAIDTLLQRYTNLYGANNPFLSANSNGFLYQYENTISYRMSGGPYVGYTILDQEQAANSIEYTFETKSWHRCIELNGERNRIQYHVYFNYKHLVTLVGDSTIYDMSGQYYYNEVRNPSQPNPYATDAYLAYPFRYERVTPVLSQPDYSEFETEYVEIDFVFGDSNINFSTAPFQNAQFLVTEGSTPTAPVYIVAEKNGIDGQPVFMLVNNTDNPGLTDLTYNYLYNPSIELFYSDNGGISFNSADVRVFSQQGQYQWRMRWYQLGPSRNRVYKLVCVSMVPIVILGGVMNVRRISGGAN